MMHEEIAQIDCSNQTDSCSSKLKAPSTVSADFSTGNLSIGETGNYQLTIQQKQYLKDLQFCLTDGGLVAITGIALTSKLKAWNTKTIKQALGPMAKRIIGPIGACVTLLETIRCMGNKGH